MKKFTKRAIAGLATLIALFILLGAAYLTSQRRPPVLTPSSVFCDSTGVIESSVTHRLVLYLDLNSCLSCNEDMDAWRELCGKVKENGGQVLVYAKRSDSTDVAWAMHLEGISDTTRVLGDDVFSALGWKKLGTPVKLLLDSQCRTLKIAGWMGGWKQSRRFIEEVLALVCTSESTQVTTSSL